jgi:hypothetical protein
VEKQVKVAIAEVELSAQKPPGHPHMCQYNCHQEEEVKQRKGEKKPLNTAQMLKKQNNK